MPPASQASVCLPSQVDGASSYLPDSPLPISRGFWPEQRISIETDEAQQIGCLPVALAAAIRRSCAVFSATAGFLWELEPRHPLSSVKMRGPLGGPPVWVPLAHAAVLLALRQREEEDCCSTGAEGVLVEESREQQQQPLRREEERRAEGFDKGVTCKELASLLHCTAGTAMGVLQQQTEGRWGDLRRNT
ncbi:hypothetical protein cyc_09354 [Cyclospora cayetanensis]|uniref:Uncharacterized protein n=1 Tax=Cyclospora cayetanensis TaxID=88456 RepID=A0A1D3CTX9_9EIME|nr:hypothetical protein cyc_09354 [Cyclospora cayetanensis]